MSIGFTTIGSGLTRAGAFVSNAADWTRTGWFNPLTSNPSGGNYRTYFSYGDIAFVNNYIWCGSNVDTGDIFLVVWDGSSHFTAVTVVPLDTWFTWALTYNSTSHALKLYVNNVLAATLTVNLGGITFVQTDEYVATDGVSWSSIGASSLRSWQTEFTLSDLIAEWASSTPVISGSLLAATLLTGPADLADTSGNGRGWSAVGAAATTISGPYPPPPTDSFLLVLSDQRDLGRTDAVTLDPATGAITAHITTPGTLPYGAQGDTVADGHFGITYQTAGSNQVQGLKVFASDYTLLLTVSALTLAGTATTNPNAPVASNGVDTWYVAINSTPSILKNFNAAGLIGGSWTLPAHGGPARCIAVSRNGGTNILYYTETGTKPIYAYNLDTSAALPNFVTNSGTDFFWDLITLTTGDVLCLGQTNSAVTTSWAVRRYNSSGVLQQTYALGVQADAYELPFLWLDYADETSFWVKAFTDGTGHTARYFHIRISDGTVFADFVVQSSIVDGDGKVPSTCPEMALTTSTSSNTVCILVNCISPGCPANVGLLPVLGPNGCADQL